MPSLEQRKKVKATQNFDKILGRMVVFINNKTGPILSLYNNARYNDEPLFFQYTAVVKKTANVLQFGDENEQLTGGMSFLKEKAMVKALGEAIERYCLSICRKDKLYFHSLKELGSNALDLLSVVNISEKQLQRKEYFKFKIRSDMKLGWVKGYSVTKKQEIYIPAQLIFVPYNIGDEPIIRLPITTGAAAGMSLEDAILRGICEVIERDSFMIYYLNKLTPTILDTDNSKDKFIKSIAEKFKRYHLNLYIFDISTDIPVTTIMAIIVDKTGLGPAICIGLKSSLDLNTALVGAIEEAQHVRPWLRDHLHNKQDDLKSTKHDDVDLLARGLFWSKIERIKDLSFFLKSKKAIPIDKHVSEKNKSSNLGLRDLISYFKKINMEVVYTDVTQPEIKKAGFYVVKVIIPTLQPLYLDEGIKYLGGERLYNVPKKLGLCKSITKENDLNQIPHPFL